MKNELLGVAAAALLAGVLAPVSAAPGNPMKTLVHDVLDAQPLVGVVSQRLRAGHYTYLAIATPRGEQWVVTMGTGAPLGASVSVQSFGHSDDFHSKRLDRDFARLVFGIVSRTPKE